MIMTQILTEKMPFHEYKNHFQLVAAFYSKGHITPFTPRTEGDRNNKAIELQKIDPVMRAIMNMCWVKSARQRPSAEAIRLAIQTHPEILGTYRSQVDNGPRRFAANMVQPETTMDHNRIYDILDRVSDRSHFVNTT